MTKRILLLGDDAHVVRHVAAAARAADFDVQPARRHEHGIDALERVRPDIALVHLEHSAAALDEFRLHAAYLGARVLLFFGIDFAEERDADAKDPDPLALIEFDGNGATVMTSLASALAIG